MDVSYDADWLLDFDQIWLCLEELEDLVEETHDLLLCDGPLSGEELLEHAPVDHTVAVPELVRLNGLVDHPGALGIGQLAVGNGVRQQTEAVIIILFHHFYMLVCLINFNSGRCRPDCPTA